MSPDSLFSLSGFQKSLLISVYQIRRRISAAPRPTLTKGNPLFPASPFVPRPACFLLLRRVSPYFPPYHSYRDQLAPCYYEGSASFSRPAIRIRSRQALPLTKGIPLFPAIPFVPRPACFLHLRRVSFLFASHSRILARQALPLTKGIPLFPPHPSYRVQLAPCYYEGSASFSRPTIRIRARQALPPTKGILRFPASPFVPQPACSPSLRRVSFLSASHHSYPHPPRLSDATTKRKSRAFRPASPQGLHPLQQPALKILFYPHCASLSTVIYPFSSTAPITQETL